MRPAGTPESEEVAELVKHVESKADAWVTRVA